MKKSLYFLAILIIFALFFFRMHVINASKSSDYGLKEGDLISAIFSDDPDVYIVNEHGFKRLFLNPEIFKFYTHLGGFANIKLVTPEIRDSFPTSGYFRNCEDNDKKVYGTSVEGEDGGRLHWINKSGDQAVQEDPDFFKKVFCINRKEFNWYPRGNEFKLLKEVPKYTRQEGEEKFVICHHPASDSVSFETIRVASPSLEAHFQHGDSHGACPTYILPSLTPTPVPTATPPLVTVSPSPISSPSFTVTPTPTSTPTITTSPSPTTSVSFSPTPVPTTMVAPTMSTPPSSTGPTPTPTPTPTISSGPSAPTSVTATLATGKIVVNWSDTADAYYIYRSVNSGAYQFLVGKVDPVLEDSGSFPSGYTYRYKIYGCTQYFAQCSYITGTESNIVTVPALTPTPTPAAPAGALIASDGSWCYTSDGDSYNPGGIIQTDKFNKGYCQDSSGQYLDEFCSGNVVREYYCFPTYESAELNTFSHISCGSYGNVYSNVDCSSFGSNYVCSNGACIVSQSSTSTSSSVSFDNFSRNLTVGSRGDDVKQLQALLINEVSYPANLITGYFGLITREAVKKLQTKYGIKPVSGYFGEITRKTLDAFIYN